VPYLSLLAVTTLCTAVAFDVVVVAAELDLPLALLIALTGLTCLGLVAGGRLGGPRWSLRAGLRNALVLLGFQLPLVATVTGSMWIAGSPRVRDLVFTQGAAPWRWNAFASPALALGLVLILVALAPRPAAIHRELPELDPLSAPPTPAVRAARSILVATDSGHVFAVASVVALTLLGGYALPGVSPTVQASAPLWQALGAAVLVGKTWLVLAAVAALRWLLPELGHGDAKGLFWRVVVPGSAAVVGLVWTQQWAEGYPTVRALANGLGFVLLPLVLVLGIVLASRIVRSLARPPVQMTVNPWL
jgi:NADH:ubiquinone oxidoreductase subunit H